MMTIKRPLLVAFTVVLFVAGSTSFSQRSPLRLARSIADRVIRETDLSFRLVSHKPLPDLQVIDFLNVFGRNPSSAAYAFSVIVSDRDTVLRFGVSHDCPLHIWLNGATVFEHSSARPILFKEVGYELFYFNDTMTVSLHRGENQILVKAVLSAEKNVLYLKELIYPKKISTAKFELRNVADLPAGAPWIFAGVFSSEGDPYRTVYSPEEKFSSSYVFGKGFVSWKVAPTVLLSELIIKPDAAYTRESYAEWMYPSGTVLLSLLHLSKATGDPSYERFVRSVCDFTVMNLPLFKHQYENQHALRNTNYRIFRRSMLDDTGAPVLPYVELLPRSNDKRLRDLVETMAAYVSAGQVRLPDGTLCRYEQIPLTIWADDLFMSVPFLLRLGEQSGSKSYFDDAAKQIVNFNRYLVDKKTGLYRHGYYDFKKEQSPVTWGRANGWVVWAHAEALLHLPKTHPSYKALTTIFRRHMEALVAVQGKSGLWHQLLERPDSFEETSCTAMFMIGMARGMRLGILDKSFKEPFEKAWNGLQSRISDDGVIKDIGRGTEISNDPSYYLTRERFDNDPRGLGAVVTALIEAEVVLK
jgi:rhamnogalacturonyl hydrolase YesR